MYCKNCGSKIDDDALFCPKCGNEVAGNDNSNGVFDSFGNLFKNEVKEEKKEVINYFKLKLFIFLSGILVIIALVLLLIGFIEGNEVFYFFAIIPALLIAGLWSLFWDRD